MTDPEPVGGTANPANGHAPPPGGTGPLRVVSSGFAALLANGANSASNMVLVVLLARNTTAREFGAIAVILTIAPLAVAFVRGAVVEPLIGLATVGDGTEGRTETGRVATAALVGVALAGVALQPSVRLNAIPLAVGVAASVLMERERWSLLQRSRSRRMMATDCLWLAVQVGGAAIAFDAPMGASTSWAAGGVLAVLLARSGSRAAEHQLGSSARVRPAWGLEYVLAAASLQVVLLVLPLTTGVTAVGALRGAASLLGFTTILANAVYQVGIIKMADPGDRGGVERASVRLAAVAAALVAAVTLPLLALPSDVGESVLGDTWDGARAVLVLMIAHRVIASASLGSMMATRVLDLSAGLVRDRLMIGLFTIAAAVGGGAVAGARGAAWALCVGSALTLAVWSRRVRHGATRAAP